MPYRWVDHTAEVELEIEAPDERAVFAEAMTALAELLGISGSARLGLDTSGGEVRLVSAEARDRPSLLAAWIEELVFLAESEGFVATRIESIELSGHSVGATVAGVVGEPPPLVKAVTYHRLAFGPSGTGYVAHVVLDV